MPRQSIERVAKEIDGQHTDREPASPLSISSESNRGRSASGAEADLLEKYVRLEESRAGLGDRFYRTLDSALERLRQYPEMAPTDRETYRRLVRRPFGFGFFYVIKGDRLLVGTILDLRRDPALIRERLSP